MIRTINRRTARIDRPRESAARSILLALALSAWCCAPCLAAELPPRYTLVVLTGESATGMALGINNRGTVVGYRTIPGEYVVHPFVHRAGKTTYFDAVTGIAEAVNEAGQVTGYVNNDRELLGFRTRGDELTIIPFAEGSAHPVAIDEAGRLCGWGLVLIGFDFKVVPIVSVGDTFVQIPASPNSLQAACQAMNEQGDMGGSDTLFDGPTHARIITNGRGRRLALPGAVSSVRALNEKGYAVGYYRPERNGMYRGFLYRYKSVGDAYVDLGTGDFSARVLGVTPESINNRNEIVGVVQDENEEWSGFYWSAGHVHDLNRLVDGLPPGWRIVSANGINDWGQIAATAALDATSYGVLLTPGPAQSRDGRSPASAPSDPAR